MKSFMITGMLTAAFLTHAESFQIQINEHNEVIASKGVNIENVTILEGKAAMLDQKAALEEQLANQSKSDTLSAIYQSAKTMEELVFIDDMLKNESQNKATVYGSGYHCGTNTFLDYSFQDTFYRYTMNVSAYTGAPGPFPPNTPTQYVTSFASITSGSGAQQSDTDSAQGTSLFVSASSSIGSGLHASNNPRPFEARGNYYAFNQVGCSAFKVIKVTGTKAWSQAPTIDNIQN